MKIDTVARLVAPIFNVSRKSISSLTRGKPPEAEARMFAMYVFTFRNKCTRRATAKEFRRHPSSVTHAILFAQRRMQADFKIRAKIMKLVPRPVVSN